jgi:hypothetical protein
MRPPKELEEALTAVVRRLAHLRANWNQALENYFHPGGFRIALQNAIATSRTVTFILQSHKAAIPDFDNWYKPFIEKFRNNPIMVWAKDARNKIEKQGDLETLSQVRAELIASYAGNPRTDGCRQMWSGVQKRFAEVFQSTFSARMSSKTARWQSKDAGSMSNYPTMRCSMRWRMFMANWR